MAEDKFFLKWGNHEKNIAEALKSLNSDGAFYDVSIACEGRILETHKLILAASSSVFGQILTQFSHPHPMIYLRGIKASDMNALLHFMYCGEVSVEQDQLQSFLAAAEELKVQGLGSNNREEFQNQVIVKDPLPDIVFKSAEQHNLKKETNSGKPKPIKASESALVKKQCKRHKKKVKKQPAEVTNIKAEPENEKTLMKEWKDLKKFIVLGEWAPCKSGSKSLRRLSQCAVCGKTNASRSILLAHLESAHFKNTFKHTCTKCGRSYGTRRGSIKHRKTCHATIGKNKKMGSLFQTEEKASRKISEYLS